MEITKVSSKGQVVIPLEVRKKIGLDDGQILSVSAKDNLIVLKRIENKLEEDDLKTFNEIKEAWQEIEQGKCRIMDASDFLNEIDKW